MKQDNVKKIEKILRDVETSEKGTIRVRVEHCPQDLGCPVDTYVWNGYNLYLRAYQENDF